MPNRNTPIVYENKELLLSTAIVFACLALSLLFPVGTDSLSQSLTKILFFLVIIPILYIKFVLKKNLSAFGLNIKNKKEGIIWGISMLAVSLAAAIALSNVPSLKHSYHLPTYVVKNFWLFLAYELIFINIYTFISEFFWRGFVLFTFSEKFCGWAILIQAAVATGAAMISNDLSWKFFSVPILSAASGIVSYKSKSFIFSYFMTILFIIILDSYLIYNLNK